jgi:anti-sigma factor ChrR (cupin superfamily)
MEKIESAVERNVLGTEIYPGIICRSLWQGSSGAKAMTLEFTPGSSWPHVDKHDAGPEEVFVISGILNDGEKDYPEGAFIHNPKYSMHVPQSKHGCKIFVFYPEG